MPIGELSLSEQERQTRRNFLDFTERDVTLLKELKGLIHQHADDIINKFYTHLLRFKETKGFLSDEEGNVF